MVFIKLEFLCWVFNSICVISLLYVDEKVMVFIFIQVLYLVRDTKRYFRGFILNQIFVVNIGGGGIKRVEVF